MHSFSEVPAYPENGYARDMNNLRRGLVVGGGLVILALVVITRIFVLPPGPELASDEPPAGLVTPDLNLLQEMASVAKGDDFSVPRYDYVEAREVSLLMAATGRYADAHRLFDSEKPPYPTDEIGESLPDLEPVDAVTALAEAAADQRVLIVNEAHHVPQHRILTLRLLPALKRAGYTHFAAETLNQRGGAMAERGYPQALDGAYLNEPVYADLLRQAVSLGFIVVPYDSGTGFRRRDREIDQAQHLKTRVFDVDPDAKLVVHVGYSHNRESQDANEGAGAMAYYLAATTGFDPLTVDQTELSEHSAPRWEHGFYESLCGAGVGDDAVVFRRQDGTLWALPGEDRDVTVCVPRSRYVDGRPTWLSDGRLPFAVPQDLCGDEPFCLAEAHLAAEGEGSVPLDRLFVRRGSPAPILMLRPGAYRLEAVFADGGISATEIQVGE